VVSSTLRPHFTTGKYPVPILQEAAWAPGPVWMGGKSHPHRDSILERPARSQSLYQLSYRAHTHKHIYRVRQKCIHTLTKENSTLYNRLLQIYIIFPSKQQYDICIYFNITYIVILATCFDSYESSSGIHCNFCSVTCSPILLKVTGSVHWKTLQTMNEGVL